MSAINGPSSGFDVSDADPSGGLNDAPDLTVAAAPPAPTTNATAAPTTSTATGGLAARGQAQAAWARAGWDVQNDDPSTTGDSDDARNAGAKVLGGLEPTNDSGFTPPVPDGTVKALNILEILGLKLGIAPLKRYNSWVDQGVLMRGSEQNADGFAALKAQGIKTVVNLRLEDNGEKPVVEKLGMKAVWLPAYDQGVPSRQEVAAFLKLVNDKANQPVYVHCEQGVGRTGIMSAAWRISHDGLTADQAIDEARKMGMKSSNQEQFIRQFASDFAAGAYSGQI